MMTSDTDRIYDLLMLQTGTLAKIEQSQEDLKERLFGASGNPGIIQHFGLQLADHSKTLGYVKGAAAILTLLWSGAIAVLAALIKSNHH